MLGGSSSQGKWPWAQWARAGVIWGVALAAGIGVGLPGLHRGETATLKTAAPPVGVSQYPKGCAPTLTDPNHVRFAAFGDMGSRLSGQFAVARGMTAAYDQSPFSFALMLGDNIYPDGDVAKLGDSSFTQPYAALLKRGVCFYPALGNHDIQGGYTAEGLKFFGMPGRYYAYPVGRVQFFAIDTNQFDAAQRDWLAMSLARLNRQPKPPQWIVVYGHHPVWSSGLHGSSATLLKELRPLLEHHGVDLYLAGHDHDYERFAPAQGVTYIVSGGGGASLRGFRPKIEPGSLVRASKFHWLRLEATPAQLHIQAIDPQGHRLDEVTLTPKVRVPIGRRKAA